MERLIKNMILSVSRRTDIPCYYAEWFMTRLRAGYALVRNPMNHAQISHIPLTPDIVDCIVFWTKDAKNMLPHLKELDQRGYQYYFQFTLTPYDHTIEPRLRNKTEIEDTFIALSNRIGCKRVIWRYDPIILNNTLRITDHEIKFRRMCEKLAPYTDTVTISFVDLYPKLKTDVIRMITASEIAELASMIGKTAAEYHLRVTACCEDVNLEEYGILRASCIDRARIEAVCGCPLDLNADKNQRNGCGCIKSIDIGAYNTCPSGCVYCYANKSAFTPLHCYCQHDSNGELLTGMIGVEEKVSNRKIKSHLVEQTNLF